MNQLNKINHIQPALAEVRENIIALDNQLINLLAKRRGLSQSVALNKLSTNKLIRDESREKILLNTLVTYTADLGLDANYITRLFHIIIEDSIIFQQKYLQSLINPNKYNNAKAKIAVLGGKGSYSYLAAKNHFSNFFISENQKHTVEHFIAGYSSFNKLFESLIKGKTDYAIVPFENTTSGGIAEVFDLLVESDLSIIGETKYAIEHCLVVASGTRLEDIKTIYAHPEASRQSPV